MSSDLIVRVLSLCIVLAGAETLHGIFRATVLVPRIGKQHALRLSIVSGSALAFVICWWLVPPLGLTAPGELLLVGLTLSAFMASFDAVLGRWLMRRPWRKVLDDFNPATGNYLLFGLMLMVGYPWLVMRFGAG